MTSAHAMETSMTSRPKETTPGPGEPDMILLALFQSRLKERSVYLGQEIQSQRRRLSVHAQRALQSDDAGDRSAALARIERAEQALAAVQQAQERMGTGRYGRCDECDEAIGWDDLLEAPEKTVCRGCSQFAGLTDRLSLES
jgi:RNA polymerase-binding transcription factor DksA